MDHVPDAESEVFLMDMRAQGKGFDAFYQRALEPRRELHPLAPLDDQGRPARRRTC